MDLRESRLPCVLLAAASLAAGLSSAYAQQIPPTPADTAAVGSIRGEVYDSLLGASLEGAHVGVRGTALRATTDRQGRFRLDSVPAGRQVLVLAHPSLDSAGLSDLRWAVEVADGRTTQAVLAVPSLHTFAGRACGVTAAPIGADSGIVFGAVRDAERRVRLAGAHVVATWVAVDRTRRRASAGRQGRDVPTDSLGNYYLCGVPSSVGISVQTSAGPFTSAEVQLELNSRRLLRRDLSLSREPASAPGDTTFGTRRGGATLIGTVRGEQRGYPVERALASVVGAAGEAASDGSGRFLLGDLPSGSQMLLVRHIGYGYSATPVELRNRDTTRVDVTLSTVTILDTIQVTTTQWVRAEIDELRTRLRLGTSNRVLTAEDLAPMGTIQQALQEFPGMNIARAAERVRLRRPGIIMTTQGRPCNPDVYIDGLKADIDMLEFYRPSDLIALEVYRTSEIPQRYINPYNMCAVVLAWTRYLQ